MCIFGLFLDPFFSHRRHVKKNTAQSVSMIYIYSPVVSSFVLLFWHSVVHEGQFLTFNN